MVSSQLRIGDEPTSYTMHESLLVNHSEYFKNALNGSWKESKDGVIPLEDVDCNTCAAHTSATAGAEKKLTKAVDIFVDWLYTGQVPREPLELVSVAYLRHLGSLGGGPPGSKHIVARHADAASQELRLR